MKILRNTCTTKGTCITIICLNNQENLKLIHSSTPHTYTLNMLFTISCEWGFKEPRTMYYAPLMHYGIGARFYLHIVRGIYDVI
jgi:hypothetical protein